MSDFSSVLNDYIKKAECSGDELSKASGISVSSLSRYKNGTRAPQAESDTVKALALGLSKLYKKESKEEIYQKLNLSLPLSIHSFKDFSACFDLLLRELHINVGNLSTKMNVSASYLSRIRNGSRLPSSFEYFMDSLANYIYESEKSDIKKSYISSFFKISSDFSLEELKKSLYNWFGSNNDAVKKSLLLLAVNNFSQKDIIDTSRISKQKSGSAALKQPQIFDYTDMVLGELAFYKNAALSTDTGELFIYKDLPFCQNDKSTTKKMLFGLCANLSKGTKVKYICNIGEDFSLMEKEISILLPLFYSGDLEISFISFKDNKRSCVLMVAPDYVLTGESINKIGRAILSSDPKEIKYQKEKFTDKGYYAYALAAVRSENEPIENKKSNKSYKGLNISFSGRECIVSKSDNPKLSIRISEPKLIESIKASIVL